MKKSKIINLFPEFRLIFKIVLENFGFGKLLKLHPSSKNKSPVSLTKFYFEFLLKNMFSSVPVSHFIDFEGQKLELQTGLLAKQATQAVLAKIGQTTVLAAVVVGKEKGGDYFQNFDKVPAQKRKGYGDAGYFIVAPEMQLKVNGKIWKKINGGGDEIVARRNYDKVDSHITIDTTFAVYGNNSLIFDSDDCLEHALNVLQ